VNLKARQVRRDELTTAIAARESFALRRFDRKAIEAKVNDYVKGWHALLTKRVEDGRQLLREVLAGPLRFTPDGKTYRFEGEAVIGQLVAGMVGLPTVLASPTGRLASGCLGPFQKSQNAHKSSKSGAAVIEGAIPMHVYRPRDPARTRKVA
jgi:hypothetical protein